MSSPYVVDLSLLNMIFSQNFYYFIKLFLILPIVFYFLPVWLFPQPVKKFGIEKIIINMVFMISYIEAFVTLFIFLKIFSIPLFIIFIILTKLFFLKFYYKKDLSKLLRKLQYSIVVTVAEILDNPKKYKEILNEKLKNLILKIEEKVSVYAALKAILFAIVFGYVVFVLSLRGLYTMADSIPDTAQFIEWVSHLHHNILYAPYQNAPDMFGMSILMFFIQLVTNMDVVMLFAIYPSVLVTMLYLAIYFVLKDFTKNEYIGLIGVAFHGIILMSPLADYFLSSFVVTTTPHLVEFFHFKFYYPNAEEIKNAIHFPFESFYRYTTGMAYEHASVFMLLNAYFFLKAAEKGTMKYIVLYTLTLYLVFTFHGGGAIPLLVVSLIITILAIIFRKLDWNLFKRGLLAVIIASILGNVWMLSALKFGIPKDFGAAAPFLDKLFRTQTNMKEIMKEGFSVVKYLYINKIQFTFMFLLLFDMVVSLFMKRRFWHLGFLAIPLGIFIVYFGPNAGFPLLASYLRLSEYLFIADTLILGFNLYLIARVVEWKFIWMSFSYFIILTVMFLSPKWYNHMLFYKILNFVQWNEDAEFIYMLSKKERNFSWTVVAYVPDYPKVKNKGFHINTNKFILKYSPYDKYLKIPTKKVFLIVEDNPNPYRGLDEWYNRWKPQIQNALKTWIAIYSQTHNNIKLVYKTKNISVYEIDNSEYVKLLEKKNDGHKISFKR
ncbi:hypothetical protein [Caminibacter pacificus]